MNFVCIKVLCIFVVLFCLLISLAFARDTVAEEPVKLDMANEADLDALKAIHQAGPAKAAERSSYVSESSKDSHDTENKSASPDGIEPYLITFLDEIQKIKFLDTKAWLNQTGCPITEEANESFVTYIVAKMSKEQAVQLEAKKDEFGIESIDIDKFVTDSLEKSEL